MSEKQFSEFVEKGRVTFGPVPSAIVDRLAVEAIKHHANYPRTCLSCGARESLDGTLPCGH